MEIIGKKNWGFFTHESLGGHDNKNIKQKNPEE